MKNIVSFDTAKRLKGAGFPQPKYIEIGFVYSDEGDLLYLRECSFIVRMLCGEIGEISGLVFAPTATDILVRLEECTIYSDIRSSKFICSTGSNSDGIAWFSIAHENPAEAAALAWLEINEKKWYDKIEIATNDVLPGSHVK